MANDSFIRLDLGRLAGAAGGSLFLSDGLWVRSNRPVG